jgi:hypothetical protein
LLRFVDPAQAEKLGHLIVPDLREQQFEHFVPGGRCHLGERSGAFEIHIVHQRPRHHFRLQIHVECHFCALRFDGSGETVDEIVLFVFSEIAKFARAQKKLLLEHFVERRRRFIPNAQRNLGDRAVGVLLQHSDGGHQAHPSQEIKRSFAGIREENAHEMKRRGPRFARNLIERERLVHVPSNEPLRPADLGTVKL